MPVEIKIANDGDAKEWDELVSLSVQGTIFHTWTWLKIVETHTKMKLFPLIGMMNNKPIGIFPLFFQKKGPIRLVFSPPPQTVQFYLGPVISEYHTMKQEKREKLLQDFQTSVDTFLKDTLNPQYISISLGPNFQDPRSFIWAGYSIDTHYDYTIDFDCPTEILFNRLTRKQHQNVHRAKKRGISVDLGGKQEYEEVLNLLEIRYADQGKNDIRAPREYLSDVYDAYKDFIKVFIATSNDEIVSGTIDIQYKDIHYSWIGNPKPQKHISPSPNDVIMCESIRFAQKTGMKYYVTMNAAGNERLHSYYASKFDPDLNVHFSLKKSTGLMNLMEKGYSGVFRSLL